MAPCLDKYFEFLKLYYNNFVGAYPTLHTAIGIVEDMFGEVVDDDEVRELVRNWDFPVDGTLFCALCCMLFDSFSVEEARLLYSNTCSRCKKSRQMFQFITPSHDVSPRCNICRDVTDVYDILPVAYYAGLVPSGGTLEGWL